MPQCIQRKTDRLSNNKLLPSKKVLFLSSIYCIQSLFVGNCWLSSSEMVRCRREISSLARATFISPKKQQRVEKEEGKGGDEKAKVWTEVGGGGRGGMGLWQAVRRCLRKAEGDGKSCGPRFDYFYNLPFPVKLFFTAISKKSFYCRHVQTMVENFLEILVGNFRTLVACIYSVHRRGGSWKCHLQSTPPG